MIFIAITIMPAFYYYAMSNLAHTDILAKPGWLYALALVTAFISAYLCEGRFVHKQKKI